MLLQNPPTSGKKEEIEAGRRRRMKTKRIFDQSATIVPEMIHKPPTRRESRVLEDH